MQNRLNFPTLKLKQNVPARWNATFDMLERFRRNKEPLQSTFGLINIRPNLEDRHWLVMEQAIEVLKAFDAAIKEVSGEDHVTISLYPYKWVSYAEFFAKK